MASKLIIFMNTALMNEFCAMQKSMQTKYDNLLNEQFYAPIKNAQLKTSRWVTKRAKMLMKLESGIQYKLDRLTKRLLKYKATINVPLQNGAQTNSSKP